jgi:periplasmic protein TonB
LSLKKFFIYSTLFHAFIIAVILLTIPVAKEKRKGDEFMTNLVSPDEIAEKPRIMPVPHMRPVPRSMPRIRQRTIPRPAVPAPNIKEHEKNSYERGGPLSQPPVARAPSHPASQGRNREERPESRGGNMSKPQSAGPSLKDKLFDKKIIGDIAKQSIEKYEKENKDKTFTFNAKEYKFLIYNRRLKDRIESVWEYPREAAEKGIYGDLIIKFAITKNGSLGAVEIVRTSGHKNLDDAAIKALKDAAPYWPLPDEWNMDAYSIEGHFVYTIYGYGII